jgi:hypothetical protein
MLNLPAIGQSPLNADGTMRFGANAEAIHDLVSISSAYRNAVLNAITTEVNNIAIELQLPEKLPIANTNVVTSYIVPPQLVERLGAVGNVTTANYTYYFSVGKKFSFVSSIGLEQEYAELRSQSLLPMSQMDTNGAYQLAVRWLAATSMDLEALQRDCNVHIVACTPEGEQGLHFVPVYWVYWSKRAQEGHGSAASVELFAPAKKLMQLRVEESKYILRKPLVITNVDFLLTQTNGPPSPR